MTSIRDSFPRCVVLPIVGKDGRSSPAGLALHFLLGNVVVLYPAFQEFWFGWPIAKIFPAPVDIAPFETAAAKAPAAFMAHDLLGWARYRNQEYAKSREAFVESVRINPHGAGAMAGLIWCGVMMQDSKEVEYWAPRKAASCDGDAGKAREKAMKLLEKNNSTFGIHDAAR